MVDSDILVEFGHVIDMDVIVGISDKTAENDFSKEDATDLSLLSG